MAKVAPVIPNRFALFNSVSYCVYQTFLDHGYVWLKVVDSVVSKPFVWLAGELASDLVHKTQVISRS